MLKFLYVCDTHFGDAPADPWHIQPRCPQLMPALFDRLAAWLADNRFDFVLHGGDAIESASFASITAAADLFSSLPCPVYLCLGNHDLFGDRALDLWRRHSRGLLPAGQPNYVVERPEATLLVLANHWHDLKRPYYWDEHTPQTPLLDESQRLLLETTLAESARTRKPVILALHSPILAMRPDESAAGLPDETLSPALFSYLQDRAARYPSLKLLLAGHSHVSRIRRLGPLPVVATAAFGESPFEGRLIIVDDSGSIRVETLTFASLFGLPAPYDASKAFAQGSPSDRTAVL